MVTVVRYSGWPIVHQSRDGTSGLVKRLREVFVTYGIADELSSDGGPLFTAEETEPLFPNWGAHHRLSSVVLANSNGRAELGIKTCKRMLLENTGTSCNINFDKLQRDMLQNRNTPYRYWFIPSTYDISTTNQGLHPDLACFVQTSPYQGRIIEPRKTQCLLETSDMLNA